MSVRDKPVLRSKGQKAKAKLKIKETLGKRRGSGDERRDLESWEDSSGHR